jgi:hypothetical protein
MTGPILPGITQVGNNESDLASFVLPDQAVKGHQIEERRRIGENGSDDSHSFSPYFVFETIASFPIGKRIEFISAKVTTVD